MAAAAAAAAALRVVWRVVWTGAGITGCFPDTAAPVDDACKLWQECVTEQKVADWRSASSAGGKVQLKPKFEKFRTP